MFASELAKFLFSHMRKNSPYRKKSCRRWKEKSQANLII